MKRQITGISPFQTATAIALLYFVMTSLPLILFMGVMFSFVRGHKPPTMGFWHGDSSPFLLFGSRLYLYSYWCLDNLVANGLAALNLPPLKLIIPNPALRRDSVIACILFAPG